MIKLFVFCFIICTVLAVDYPSSLPKCKFGDNACVAQAAQYVLQTYAKTGNDEIDLSVLDPYYIDSVDNTGLSNLPINFKLSNSVLTGFSRLAVKTAVFTQKGNTVKARVTISVPKYTISGRYVASGQIFQFPIEGNGPFKVVLNNADGTIRFIGKLENVGGENFLRIQKFKTELNATTGSFRFDNLFNGDKVLGESINNFLNQNFQLVFETYNDAIFNVIGRYLRILAQQVFDKVPYDSWWLK